MISAWRANSAGTPKTNVGLLLIGTLLASWIGTTGASMVMIRPLLRANRWRSKCVHTVVFFIFLVSNIGGSLTPIGDPPLLMGFMRGVPFTWTLVHLLPIMGLNVVLLLALYFVLDNRAYKKDLAAGLKPPSGGVKLRLTGAHNIIFMLVIVAAVILSGVLPKPAPVPGCRRKCPQHPYLRQRQPELYRYHRDRYDSGSCLPVFKTTKKDRLRVLDILKEQNHSKYWLYKQMELSYQNFNRMVQNETSSIKFENLEKLCSI